MRTLFLNPPAYENFDGGAGSRYQATREVWSFWYPTWLCYPAGMIKDSRVLPGNVGLLGIGEGAGLTLMVLKRAREAVYNMVGLFVLARAGYSFFPQKVSAS